MNTLLRALLAVSVVFISAACTTPHPPPAPPSVEQLLIDRSVSAKSQNSRVEVIVLHYTSTDTTTALRLLSEQNVSSHYLITDADPPHVYQLVDESRRAWHAGQSEWYGRTSLNASSIGIELVNRGRDAHGHWAPWPPAQIHALAVLLRNIMTRHQVKDRNIVAHSDIAPQRKIDPGPRFPWKELADQGMGRWYDQDLMKRYEREFSRKGLPPISWVQEQLIRAGYAVARNGVLDAATRRVIGAFQMHYRPARHNGRPDAETLAILKALP